MGADAEWTTRRKEAIRPFLRERSEMSSRSIRANEGESGRVIEHLGILLALEDNTDVAGVKATDAHAVFLDRSATEDVEVVQRLRVGRAVLLRKHNMHEAVHGLTSAIAHFGAAGFQEHQVLALAHAYEQRAKWHTRRPPL
jgi:Asp-tRNA(Asn)/Glu-tRNA(Gln) amidotransferase A subunit family amidase